MHGLKGRHDPTQGTAARSRSRQATADRDALGTSARKWSPALKGRIKDLEPQGSCAHRQPSSSSKLGRLGPVSYPALSELGMFRRVIYPGRRSGQESLRLPWAFLSWPFRPNMGSPCRRDILNQLLRCMSLTNVPQKPKIALTILRAVDRNSLPDTSAFCRKSPGVASTYPNEFLM